MSHATPVRYSLRTLLVWMAVGPIALAGAWTMREDIAYAVTGLAKLFGIYWCQMRSLR